MARHANRRQRPRDHDGPYKPLPRPRGGSALPIKPDARGWWVGGEWIEAPDTTSSTYNQRNCLSTITIEDNDASSYHETQSATLRATHTGQGAGTFDFNDSGLDVPWATKTQHSRTYEVGGRPEATESVLLM